MELEQFQKFIRNFPETSGVYIFKSEGKPIYIGKAKNIKKRLVQHANVRYGKSLFVIHEADALEFIQTTTEKEALLLEANLVYNLKPKYNTLLKGTEVYPYVSISQEDFPYVGIIRRRKDGKEIYGPFTSVKFVRELLDILQTLLKFRTCKKKLSRIKRPCMDYYIGRCIGPCIPGNVTKEEYGRILDQLREFLKGNVKDVIEAIRAKMEHHAKMLDFENAARYRNVLLRMEEMLQRQGVELESRRNFDVVVGEEGLFVVFRIRGGYLLGKLVYEMEGADLKEFVEHFYIRVSDPPERVISDLRMETAADVKVDLPGDDDEEHILKMALENLEVELRMRGIRREQLKRLAEFAGLKEVPSRIEGIDISHLRGRGTVASVVVFVNGLPQKDEYRRYRINLNKPDDYKAIKEVVIRRYKKYPLPDVLFVDGGIGQVKAAYHGLKKIGKAEETVILGLAKSEERIVKLDGEYKLPLDSPVVRALVSVRDEAHRFAIEGNRRIRQRESLRSFLQSIKGIGPVRRRKLLERFSSMEELMRANEEEIAQIVGSKTLAKRIKDEVGEV